MKSKGGPRAGEVVRGGRVQMPLEGDATGAHRLGGAGEEQKDVAANTESLSSKARETHLVEAGWSGGWLRGAGWKTGPSWELSLGPADVRCSGEVEQAAGSQSPGLGRGSEV